MAKSYTNTGVNDSERDPSYEEEPDEWKYHKMEKYRAREQKGQIPDKLPSKDQGPQRLDNLKQEAPPAWEDLTDEEKALHKSPMRYAKHMLDMKIESAQDQDDNNQTSY